jgi:hypothetical protein
MGRRVVTVYGSRPSNTSRVVRNLAVLLTSNSTEEIRTNSALPRINRGERDKAQIVGFRFGATFKLAFACAVKTATLRLSGNGRAAHFGINATAHFSIEETGSGVNTLGQGRTDFACAEIRDSAS